MKRNEMESKKKRAQRRRRKVSFIRGCLMLAMICVIAVVARQLPKMLCRFSGAGDIVTDMDMARTLNIENIPTDLKELLKRNLETLEFVKNYEKKKDNPPADSVGELKPGEIPLLLQWDERWGYATYGDTMIAINGCGPTVVSMVAAGLTGNASITPYRVAQLANEQGYYEEGVGTSWSFMTEGVQQFGIYGEELMLGEEAVLSALEQGQPIICSVRPGDFTTTGHFIVLTGVENGKIKVNDPNSKIKSNQLWEYSKLEYQISNLWAYGVL